MENRPVSMPKATQAITVITQSLAMSALPMFRVVNLRSSMPTMSVPPLEASRLNRMAEPTAGSPTAKSSSISGWEVMGALNGTARSITQMKTLISRLQ